MSVNRAEALVLRIVDRLALRAIVLYWLSVCDDKMNMCGLFYYAKEQ